MAQSSQEFVQIINRSSHWGNSLKAFRTFEDAWEAACETLEKPEHKTAQECQDAHAKDAYGGFLTDKWRVSRAQDDGASACIIYKVELY